MNDEEMKQSYEKKVAESRHLRNWLLVFCIVLAAFCAYAITQWQQEKVVRVTFERLCNHYQQQWVDTLFERNDYQDLYEDCHNSNSSP